MRKGGLGPGEGSGTARPARFGEERREGRWEWGNEEEKRVVRRENRDLRARGPECWEPTDAPPLPPLSWFSRERLACVGKGRAG